MTDYEEIARCNTMCNFPCKIGNRVFRSRILDAPHTTSPIRDNEARRIDDSVRRIINSE